MAGQLEFYAINENNSFPNIPNISCEKPIMKLTKIFKTTVHLRPVEGKEWLPDYSKMHEKRLKEMSLLVHWSLLIFGLVKYLHQEQTEIYELIPEMSNSYTITINDLHEYIMYSDLW